MGAWPEPFIIKPIPPIYLSTIIANVQGEKTP